MKYLQTDKMVEKRGMNKRMRNKSVKGSLMLSYLEVIITLSVIIILTAVWGVRSITKLAEDKYEEAVTSGYKTQIKAEVQSIITVLQAEYDKSQSGLLTEEEARKEAAELVRSMRYGDDEKGYFWIDDMAYNLVMHPILEKEEGKNRYELTDEEGNKIVQQIIKLAENGEGGGYSEFYFTKDDGVTVAPKIAYSQIFEPWGWVISTGNYIDDMQAEISRTDYEIGIMGKKVLLLMFVLVLLMIGAAGIMANIFGRKLCRPLYKIQDFADNMAKGDLTTVLEVPEKNEIGQTAEAIAMAKNQMAVLLEAVGHVAERLKEAITRFAKNFGSMDASLQSVTAAMEEVAANVTAQAQSTTATTEDVEKIGKEISDASADMQSLDQNSKTMKECAENSLETLKELMAVNQRTKMDIDSMYEQTENTNDSVLKISNAAALISKIAFQTKLLSLNASIEAAKPGNEGRGFAVVAEEIGELAAQSASGAKEINVIIQELTDNSSKSLTIMQEMSKTSESQVTALANTGRMFDELKEILDSCAMLIGSIAEKIENITVHRESIAENIATLNQLASNNAAAVEENAAMASELGGAVTDSAELVKSLSDHVENLYGRMKKFRYK